MDRYVYVFRLETQWTRLGVYRAQIVSKCGLDEFANSDKPMPRDDGFPVSVLTAMSLQTGAWRYGVDTLDGLRRWFPVEDRVALRQHNAEPEDDGPIVLAVYQVPAQKLARGRKQVAWRARDAKLVRDIPVAIPR